MTLIKETEHKFYIGESPDDVSAQIEYEINQDILTILSTEVSDSLQGQGIGQKLVAYAVEYARKNHLKIIPVCPYAKKQFEKHSEYNDVTVF
jgi:predicted GNAT family acetyltransferase